MKICMPKYVIICNNKVLLLKKLIERFYLKLL